VGKGTGAGRGGNQLPVEALGTECDWAEDAAHGEVMAESVAVKCALSEAVRQGPSRNVNDLLLRAAPAVSAAHSAHSCSQGRRLWVGAEVPEARRVELG
jgi:hypothetical protein